MSIYHSYIPEKANRVLNLVLIILILFGLRAWYLSVIQYDNKVEESRKPQRRVLITPARRAPIHDRFGLPLAINKVEYRATILYSQLRAIPSVTWSKDSSGKKNKHFKRKEYIAALSNLLGEELNLDPERLEDLIHSKAALYYSIPFVIKEDLTEKEYYRLKMLEKDWLGIHVESVPKRTYPQGKVASDIVGYMGAINRKEYEAIIGETKSLERYLKAYDSGENPLLPSKIENHAHAQQRLKELQEHAYTLKDYVGKAGIEGRFDAELRGYQGKKSYYSDARGNFLRELPGSKDPTPGQRLVLTISAELQEYAEELLIKNERIREAQVSNPDGPQKIAEKQPWIKGGAIIAMDPTTGEVLTLASYPRFNPEDFINSGNADHHAKKQANILKWLESEEHIAQIWDQKRPLERERYDDANQQVYEDELWMTWENYLRALLPSDNPIIIKLKQMDTIEKAVDLQHIVETLLSLSGQNNAYWLLATLYPDKHLPEHAIRLPSDIRQVIQENLEHQADEIVSLKVLLDNYFSNLPTIYERVFLVDLCRLCVCADHFSKELLKQVGVQKLSTYRNTSAALTSVESKVRTICKEIYHHHDFKKWRQQYFKEYIRQKRDEEKQERKYAKPYVDYLDEKEADLFNNFWDIHRWQFLTMFLTGNSYLDLNSEEMKPYQDVKEWHQELSQGAHEELPWKPAYKTLQKTLSQFPQASIPDYLQTMRSFSELTNPLLGKYPGLNNSNGQQLEKHLAAAFYPRYKFGYGRSYAYRQAVAQGSLFKLVTAYAALSQRYKQLGNPNVSTSALNPMSMTDTIFHEGKKVFVGYHSDGSPIPQLYKGGRIPRSSIKSIGKIDLLRAIETSSNPYFSLLAGDYLKSPEDLANAAKAFNYGTRTGIDLPGEIPGRVPDDLVQNRTGLYSMAIGQHTLIVTPLQSAVMLSAIANGGKILKPSIIQKIFIPSQDGIKEEKIPVKLHHTLLMPQSFREVLLEGMQRVVMRMYHGSLGTLSNFYKDYPEAISDYIDLKDHILGKTSTAETVERLDLDLIEGANKYTHVWFGGISFDRNSEAFVARNRFGDPELVVVVFLKYGKFGKEAAPIAAQVIKKWREIQASNVFLPQRSQR